MSRTKPPLTPGTAPFAELDWNDQGLPHSRVFDDVYFSTADAEEESRYVFIQGNALAERWGTLAESARFLIGETGFGTGLNFLNTWKLWNEVAPQSAHLEFLSVEAFPLAPGDLRRAHAAWPGLATLSKQLRASYPRCLHTGVHRLELIPGRVTLTLLVNDASEGFEDCLHSSHPVHRSFSPGVDAWFLDGFAPARNPEMWQEGLFACMQVMSSPAATVATFSAAGNVRRGLQAHGFEVRKQPGFGHKREMICAHLIEAADPPGLKEYPASLRAGKQPLAWDVSPGHSPDSQAPGGCLSGVQQPTLIIGAGLAGCHAARALADRGEKVVVLDAAAQPASGGSGNAQGVLYAKPAAQGGAASDFNLAALQFAERHYARWWNRSGANTGVLHLARDARDAQRQQALIDRWPRQDLFQILDAQSASDLAGVPLLEPGLWFPGSGWLSPPKLCLQLLQHELIEFRQADVAQLKKNDRQWQLHDADDLVIASSTRVIIACALGLRGLLPTSHLPVQAVRGQLSAIPVQNDGQAGALRIALCGDGYVTPVQNGTLNFGASFKPNDESVALRASEHEENLKRLKSQVPGLLQPKVSADECTGRAALRCATPDRLPMVGPVPDDALMSRRFAPLGKNADASLAEPGAFLDGLYVSAGYGSRGLAYVPLATELLCWHLFGGPPPVTRELRRALHPARFLIRDIIRGKR